MQEANYPANTRKQKNKNEVKKTKISKKKNPRNLKRIQEVQIFKKRNTRNKNTTTKDPNHPRNAQDPKKSLEHPK